MIWMALVLALQAPAAPVRVGGNIPPPQKIKDARPVYPPEAQGSGVQGVVILEAVIDPTGRVSNTRVIRSIPMLDQAAIDAVRQWEYTPTLLNGTPVPVIMTVTVNFTMQGGVPNTPPGFSPMAMPPPNAGTIRLTSSRSQDGALMVWDIPTERAVALPRWSPDSGALPLSVEEAARIGGAWLRERAPDVQRFELQSVSYSRVRRANPDIDFWHYQLFFFNYNTPPRPGDQTSRVVVLPDGTVVEPRTEMSGAGLAMAPPAAVPPQSALPPGIYRPDPVKGITYPRVLNHIVPEYTEEARQKRISGNVLLECVVGTDGTVSDVRVVRSLDQTYGLDQAAIDAARKYRFAPGTKDGVPVPVAVSIEMTFTLR
jgi:TonB family protein